MRETLSRVREELKQPYFCALLLIALIPIFPEYISFFLVIAAAAFAGKELKATQRKIRIGIIGKLLIAYCSYQTLSCFYSTHWFTTLAVSLMWWVFLLAYLVVVNMLTDTHRTNRFLMCITAVAGVVGFIACLQYRLNFFLDRNVGNVWAWLDNIVFQWIPFDLIQLNYYLRAYSTFPNPNMLAQYLVMAAPFVACFNFMEQRGNRVRLFSRICLFLTFAGVMFSFSRGAYIAIIILAVALIVLNIRRRFAAVSLYVVSTLLFLPAEVVNRLFTIKKGISNSNTIADSIISSTVKPNEGVPVPPPSMTTSEIINSSGAESAVGERWEIWMESISRFFERPILGYGAGTQTTLSIFHEIGIKAPHAHNIVLQLLLEGGMIAIILMGLIGFFTVRNGIVMMKHHDNCSFWVGFSVLAFAVCFMVHGMVDYPLMVPRLVCFFIVVLGIVDQSIYLYTPQGHNNNRQLHKKLKRNQCI